MPHRQCERAPAFPFRCIAGDGAKTLLGERMQVDWTAVDEAPAVSSNDATWRPSGPAPMTIALPRSEGPLCSRLTDPSPSMGVRVHRSPTFNRTGVSVSEPTAKTTHC